MINDRIREVFKEFRHPVRVAAEKLGVSAGNLTQIINGRRNIQPYHVKLIALTYGVREEWLLTGEGEMKAAGGSASAPTGEFQGKVFVDPEYLARLESETEVLKDNREIYRSQLAMVNKELEALKNQTAAIGGDPELLAAWGNLPPEVRRVLRRAILIEYGKRLSAEEPEQAPTEEQEREVAGKRGSG